MDIKKFWESMNEPYYSGIGTTGWMAWMCSFWALHDRDFTAWIVLTIIWMAVLFNSFLRNK